MCLLFSYPFYLEYACPVWHPNLTKTCLKTLSVLKKRCLKLLYPALSYNQALNKCGFERLDLRCDVVTQKMFEKIKDPKYSLHYLLSPVKVSISFIMVLRPSYPYQLTLSKGSRYGRISSHDTAYQRRFRLF